MESWFPYGNGAEIGQTGTENGIIRLDEEFSLGARITLEEGGYQPWAITCGIYGCFVHTAFASSEEEARTKYATMKEEIGTALERVESLSEDDASDFINSFTDRFCETY